VKSAKPITVVSQLTRKVGNTAETFREVADCFFEDLFPPAPGDGSVNPSPMSTADSRWSKLEVCEIEKDLHEQASYKTPGSDGIKTIAIKKAWKDSEFRRVTIKLFSECIRIGYHLKIFRKGQTMMLKKLNKPENLAKSYRPITLLNCLGKLLEKVVQKKLASLAADTIPKHQFGGRNGFSTVDAITKLVNYAEKNQR
jgi:hypothetical protein